MLQKLIEMFGSEEGMALLLQMLPAITPYILDFLKRLHEVIIPNLKLPGKWKLLSKLIKCALSAGVAWLIAKVTILAGGDVSQVTAIFTGLGATVGYSVARNKTPKA